jgi:hypothetical protein
MPKSRLSAALSLLLVFFSGGVLGAFAYRLYSTSSVHSGTSPGGPPRKLSPEELRKKYVSDLSNAVKLDSQQISGLNAILDRTREDFDKLNEKIKPDRDAVSEKWRPARETIHNHQVESINSLLRADQRPLYESFRAERERQRKLYDQQHEQHKKQ